MVDKEAILDKLRDAIIDLDIDAITGLCEDAINAGITAYEVVIHGMAKGMEIVGQKYEEGEYFLAELIMAGETMKEGMTVLEPHIKSGDIASSGKCVIGTVKGDLHDIGKNVFVSLLKAQNYDVIDLGVDVSAEQFVAAIKAHKPNLLAMSALLTTTMGEMEHVIDELTRLSLRDNIKVIIGGAPTTKDFAEKIGADASAADAVEGVRIIRNKFLVD
jgi:5-methyltetrahydrofolate--homocysteine methyltransferase